MPFFIPKLVVGGKALAGVIKAGAAASKAGKAYAAGATVKASGLTAAKTATTKATAAYAAAGGTKALVGNALGTAGMVVGATAAHNWDVNRRVNNALNNAGVAGSQPGATGGPTYGQGGPTLDGGGFGLGYGTSPMLNDPGFVSGGGQGAEIIELKKQIQILLDEANALYREMNTIVDQLTEMSNTIGAQSDMGRGLLNLAQQSAELARQAINDLNAIINFLEERISTAEAGIADSTSTLASLSADLNAVQMTIRGDFGNGDQRIQNLTAAGLTSEQIGTVQNQVNLNIQNGTTQWDNITWHN